MPEHLVLPQELQCMIISLHSKEFLLLWGTYRAVCKAWREHVEYIAKTKWVHTGAFLYAGYMARDADQNKVFLSGSFNFQRIEGDNGVFTDTDCADKYRKAYVKACKATSPPDAELCGFVHDVKIPGMSVDWDTLTITCPWRALVDGVLAEELRVEAYRKTRFKALMTQVKRMPGDGLAKFQASLKLFGAHVHGAYEAVRKARLGYTDREGDERLKQGRVAASYRALEHEEPENEDEEDEQENEDDEEDEEEVEEEDEEDESGSGFVLR
ncbi:hypothetical protein MVEN_01037100 [Mycena venus]|uniref:Uncharacterized protein n=1 Tax=Mycena venus TaxID=2733690 RepID=A0A8H6YFE0_9AGAR|nr:hypothetical protein MVEN_01037100 [Mycena venus]